MRFSTWHRFPLSGCTHFGPGGKGPARWDADLPRPCRMQEKEQRLGLTSSQSIISFFPCRICCELGPFSMLLLPAPPRLQRARKINHTDTKATSATSLLSFPDLFAKLRWAKSDFWDVLGGGFLGTQVAVGWEREM